MNPKILSENIKIYCADSRNMSDVSYNTIDLVITSPPYNVGRKYSYYNDAVGMEDHLTLLDQVWIECKRVMRPGARIAVNVPHGTGRQPYIPLGAAVTLQIQKHFALMGTIIWKKTTATLRTSWGSWRRPSKPYLRDLCELIIIGQKDGDFEVPKEFLVKENKISVSPWLSSDAFVHLTRDIWEFETSTPSKANNHPASFPLELPRRLIKLFAYRGATILDPFAGSGTTGLAAKELGCSAVLYDVDAGYCDLMADRMKQGNFFTGDVV